MFVQIDHWSSGDIISEGTSLVCLRVICVEDSVRIEMIEVKISNITLVGSIIDASLK